MSLHRFASIVATALLCPVAFSQLTAGKITFKNPGSFSQADLEAAAGMHVGAKISTASVQAAAQRLIDTGFFEDVGGGVLPSPAGPNVVFILKPGDPAKLTPVGFENFIWLTPDELTETLRKAAPLFHGGLPEAGNQVNAITQALQAALAAKGVNTTVSYETLEPSMTQPQRVMEFRIDQPSVRLASIKLSGVTSDIAPEETKVVQKLRGSRYN